MKSITRDELRDSLIMNEKMFIVEALGEKYWKDGHIPGALQIDVNEVKDKAHALLPDKEIKTVVYCANAECQNSSKVALALEGLGYENVREYVDGKQDWVEHGLPVVRANVQ